MENPNLANDPNAPHVAPGHTNEHAEQLKKATSDTVNNTHDKVDRAADKLEHGAHRGTDKLAQAAGHGREALDKTLKHADKWKGKANNYVRDKPTQSLVIAVAAGWLLGRMLRR